MRLCSAPFRAAAVCAALVISGCFSHARNTASAASASDGMADTSADGALATSAGSQGGSQLVDKSVTDPALHMPAFTVHVPAGWKFTGMLERIPGCHGPEVPADGLAYTALAPDGVSAYEKLAGATWGWATDGTSGGSTRCKPIKMDSAAEYLLNIAIPNLRPDASSINLVPLTPQMKDEQARANQQAQAQAPAGMKITIDSARVHVQYQRDGRPVEEMITTFLACREIDMPGYPMLHRPAVARHNCHTSGILITRAPQGKLESLTSRKLPPPEIDHAWDQAVIQRMQQQFAAFQAQNEATFNAIQNHFKEVNHQMQVNHEAFMAQQKSSFDNAMAQDRATQASIDHAAQMQVRDSLNRQLFVDPNTGQKIETSNQFTHNWINSSGTAVAVGSDATFDPNGTIDPVRESWTELIPIN